MDQNPTTRSAANPEPDPRSGEPAPPGEALAGHGDGASLDRQAEKAVWTGRTHWKHYAGRLALWLLANVAVILVVARVAKASESLNFRGAFWIDALFLLITGIIVVGGVMWRVWSTRYRITTQRLFIERGILSQTIDQTELIRVDDVRIHKSLLDRIFGLGTVAVTSTDASDQGLLMVGIARPEHVAEAIRTNMRALRSRSLYVEKL